MTDTFFIVNPVGCGGKTWQQWKRFQRLFDDPISPDAIGLTDAPGHARALAAKAAASGRWQAICVVGGDGTIGEAASGIMDCTSATDGPSKDDVPALAVVPAGAGNDVCRALGIFTLQDAADALARATPQYFDLIQIDCEAAPRGATGNTGGALRRYAMMFANIGFSSAGQTKPWMKRWLGGRLAYNVAMVSMLIGHRPPKIRFQSGDHDWQEKKWTVLIANVETIGGGSVKLAPGLKPDDGQMMATIVPVRAKLDMLLRVLPKIAAGRHIHEPDFEYFAADEIHIDADPPCEIEIDGDGYGFTPANLKHRKSAIRVLA